MVFHRRGGVGVDVSVNEILENQLRVLEITRLMVVGLSVYSGDCLFEVLLPPNHFLYVFA